MSLAAVTIRLYNTSIIWHGAQRLTYNRRTSGRPSVFRTQLFTCAIIKQLSYTIITTITFGVILYTGTCAGKTPVVTIARRGPWTSSTVRACIYNIIYGYTQINACAAETMAGTVGNTVRLTVQNSYKQTKIKCNTLKILVLVRKRIGQRDEV